MAGLFVLGTALPAQQTQEVDIAAIQRIRDEEFRNSKVMELASWLTDVFGPRLTGSPSTKKAGDWAVEQMNAWGITNPHLEVWRSVPAFGRGWANERFSAQVIEPTQYPLIAYPGAWSEGTRGPQAGRVVYVELHDEADFAKYHGKLRDAWIMRTPPAEVVPHFVADARRFSDTTLLRMASAQAGQRGARAPQRPPRFEDKVERFWLDEGVSGILRAGSGDDGTVFVQSTGDRSADAPRSVPMIVLASEHYGRIFRTVEKGIVVKVEVNAQNRFYSDDRNMFNVVGDIPGADPRLRNELVMFGAHLDSWHSGTGATDNAAGSAVMLEVLRLLKTLNLPMKRTVRMALWTGEEQGLLGSHAYVRQHFGYIDSAGPHLTPEHAKVAGYFNLDNGTGAIRGVYLERNAAVGPIFRHWLEPFAGVGATTVTIANMSGTDHQSFDAVGIPGFQFIQDPIDYNTRTHHSNMDVYERLQGRDMKQNAMIVAAFVYNAANRDELLPRQPLPERSAK